MNNRLGTIITNILKSTLYMSVTAIMVGSLTATCDQAVVNLVKNGDPMSLMMVKTSFVGYFSIAGIALFGVVQSFRLLLAEIKTV